MSKTRPASEIYADIGLRKRGVHGLLTMTRLLDDVEPLLARVSEVERENARLCRDGAADLALARHHRDTARAERDAAAARADEAEAALRRLRALSTALYAPLADPAPPIAGGRQQREL